MQHDAVIQDPNPHEYWAERALWLAVLQQAIADASNRISAQNTALEHQRAMAWLTRHNCDFYEVCDLAGLDARYVRQMLQERLRGRM